MPGSQTDSPSSKRGYGKDTLRPVTIKQLLDAHHPHPDAEYFNIDNSETTQVTFVGQVRNISTQTTNVTYKLDDGTGSIEAKLWLDSDAVNNPDDPANKKAKPVQDGYARVWGRLKAFNNKRHVGANFIRPIQDHNEVHYHLLEATAVHLHFSKGPLESLQSKGGADGGFQENGYGAGGGGNGAMSKIPAHASATARRVYQCITETPQTNEGLHAQDIAGRLGLELNQVVQGAQEMESLGLLYTTLDDHTWAVLDA